MGKGGSSFSSSCGRGIVPSDSLTWKWIAWSRKEDDFPVPNGGPVVFPCDVFVGV